MPEDAEKEPEPKENELKEKERVFLQLPAGTIVKNRCQHESVSTSAAVPR